MSQGKELSALLMIEGRSIPFSGAVCEYTEGEASVATITMVPLEEINHILPRTMVHVFVKDFTYPGTVKPWILGFEGEVYAMGFAKNPQGRSFNLYCMDVSNYWDNAKQFYMNTSTDASSMNHILAAQQARAEAEKENTQVISISSDISVHLVNIITNKLKAKGNEAFLEGILDVLRGIENINPFFKYNNRRYRISDRILFKSSGNITDIFDFTTQASYLEALSGKGNGGVVTIRQIVTMLMGLVFHNFTSIPFPSKVPNGLKSGIGPSKDMTIGSFLFKPDNFMLPPPKCNVLYPDQYSHFEYKRNFFQEVSRLKFQPTPMGGDTSDGILKYYQKFHYAPAGFAQFQAKSDSTAEDPQFGNAGVSGNMGDETTESKVSHKLKEFNYLSYEEVLKGIFSDQAAMMPGAQALSKSADGASQTRFYQRATDYLFYKSRLSARPTNTSGPLNFAAVPGFPMLLLDDSPASQNVIGHLARITHQISTEGGGYTSYSITHSRLVEEKDLWNGTLHEPPIPPWYDASLFGFRRDLQPKDYQNLPLALQSRVKKLGAVTDFGNSNLKTFYSTLLGASKVGSETYLGGLPITTPQFPNLVAATLALVEAYKAAKTSGVVSNFIDLQIRRNYVLLDEVFTFLGASVDDSKKKNTFKDVVDLVFTGSVFDGGFVDKATNETSRDLELKTVFGTTATAKRRAPIKAYRDRLLKERGFRG